MARTLIDAFGIGRDVVAVVGAGGKSTLVFGLAAELRAAGRTVIATTTTKMGSDQDGGLPVVLGPDDAAVTAALDQSGACLVFASVDGHKALGVSPQWVDAAAARSLADAVVIEADGARRKLVKAPAAFEPVIPESSTLVVAVMSVRAVGRPIADVAHRAELLCSVVGAHPADIFTVEHAAALLTSPAGGRKGVPEGARFSVALTGVGDNADPVSGELTRAIAPTPVVRLPEPHGLKHTPPSR